MPKFLNTSQIIKTQGGFGFFASGSTAFQATSSQASTPAQLDITISSSLPTNIISNTTLNPFIRFTLVSGSNRTAGINQDIIIRFFSQSHIQPKYTSSFPITPNRVFAASQSLYITASSNESVTFLDVNVPTPIGFNAFGNLIHSAISSSRFNRNNVISASFTTGSDQKSHTTSINYVGLKGVVPLPTFFTGSSPIGNTSMSVSYSNTGSGALNFVPIEQLHIASASYTLQIPSTDADSLEIIQGISSSGFVNKQSVNPELTSTVLFISSSGKLGVGLRNPKATLQVSGSHKADKISTIAKPEKGRSIVLENELIKFFEVTDTDRQLDLDNNE